MVACTGMVAVKMKRYRTVEQTFRRHMNFNQSYKIWHAIFISDLSKYTHVFISARYRRMHFIYLGCYFCFTSTFLLRKRGVATLQLNCAWDILKLLSTKLLKNRIENCHKVAKKGVGRGYEITSKGKNTQTALQRQQNEKRVYRGQAGGCRLGERS